MVLPHLHPSLAESSLDLTLRCQSWLKNWKSTDCFLKFSIVCFQLVTKIQWQNGPDTTHCEQLPFDTFDTIDNCCHTFQTFTFTDKLSVSQILSSGKALPWQLQNLVVLVAKACLCLICYICHVLHLPITFTKCWPTLPWVGVYVQVSFFLQSFLSLANSWCWGFNSIVSVAASADCVHHWFAIFVTSARLVKCYSFRAYSLSNVFCFKGLKVTHAKGSLHCCWSLRRLCPAKPVAVPVVICQISPLWHLTCQIVQIWHVLTFHPKKTFCQSTTSWCWPLQRLLSTVAGCYAGRRSCVQSLPVTLTSWQSLSSESVVGQTLSSAQPWCSQWFEKSSKSAKLYLITATDWRKRGPLHKIQ